MILKSNNSFDLFKTIINKKKTLLGLFLLLFLLLIFNNIIYRVFDTYYYEQQKASLINDIRSFQLLLDNKRSQLSGYAKTISRFPDLIEVDENYFLQRRLYNLHSELNVRGIEIYSHNLEPMIQTGLGFGMKKGDNLSESIFQVVQDGYDVSFFSENDFFDLQITAVSYIYDEFSSNISGLVVVTEIVRRELLHSLAYSIDGIIQFYKLDDLQSSNEKLLQELASHRGKGYYINEENINQASYLVGYLPINNFYNQTIGYYTILKPRVNQNIIFYKILIINLLFIVAIFSCQRKLLFDFSC